MFERVHRGGGNGYNESKKGKRDIYALCSHWDDSELLVTGSFQANKNAKNKVFIEYKYRPMTNKRRAKALLLRKELLESKEYVNAYVKFPAKLMARKKTNQPYTMIRDFSNVNVSDLPILTEAIEN